MRKMKIVASANVNFIELKSIERQYRQNLYEARKQTSTLLLAKSILFCLTRTYEILFLSRSHTVYTSFTHYR